MAELHGGTTIAGYTALHSGLKEAHLGGNLTIGGKINMGVGNTNGIFGAGGKSIMVDHNNGNVTLSATGGHLYLGYSANTTVVRLSTGLYGSNGTTKIADTDGVLYYQGTNLNSKYLQLSGGTMSGSVDMGNQNINNVNHITFNDAGVNEGLEWLSTNNWKIHESSDAQDNTSGDLQIATGTTRRATFRSNGDFNTTGMVIAYGGINFNNGMLVSNDGGSTNIDHIWHDDGTNSWHFVSDAGAKVAGNSTLKAGGIDIGNGTMEAGIVSLGPSSGHGINFHRGRTNISQIYWNASSTADYGLLFKVDGASSAQMRANGDFNPYGNVLPNGNVELTGTSEYKWASGIGRIGRNGGGWIFMGNNTSSEWLRFYDAGGAEFTNKLHINNTDDASLSTDGGLVIGSKTGLNVTIDSNEIQARNNGATNSLGVQLSGGTTNFGGDINVQNVFNSGNYYLSRGSYRSFIIHHPANDSIVITSKASTDSDYAWSQNVEINGSGNLTTRTDAHFAAAGGDVTIRKDVVTADTNRTVGGGYVPIFNKIERSTGGGYWQIPTTGWYRVATCKSRAYARFQIMDVQSGRHELLEFTAGAAYTQLAGINLKMTGHVKYGSSGTINGVRILTHVSDIYAEMYLEIYFEAGALVYGIMMDNYWYPGWSTNNFTSIGTGVPASYQQTKMEMQAGYQHQPRNVFSGTSAPPVDGAGVGDVYFEY